MSAHTIGKVSGMVCIGLLCLAGACRGQAQGEQKQAQQHYDRGNVYYEEGRYREAEQEYRKALELLKSRKEAAPVTPQAEPVRAPAQTTSAVAEYTVSVDDELKISVWQNPDLDQEVAVRPDGRISLPLIGDLVAEGLTISRLDEEITGRLSEFVRNPQVSVLIKKMGGSRVVVLGEVNTPGIYNVTRARTVFEAIALAEGPTNHAVLSSVILVRNVLTQPTAQRINLAAIMKGQKLEQNMTLQPEDLIFVPKRFIANLNYFLGQIVDPVAKGVFVHKSLDEW